MLKYICNNEISHGGFMMNFLEKHWFSVVNIIAFAFALFKPLTIFGCILASLLGGIYQIIQIFKYFKGKYLFVGLIGLFCSAPFYGFIGSSLGLILISIIN